MALILERVLTEGIAELSYLIGDDAVGTAAVIDPRADVGVYLELARKHKVSITHAFETHIHADLVSGARELAAQTGTAKVHASVEGGAEYEFDVVPVRDGDRFEFGDVVITARHTPGHTPEHVAYEAALKGCGEPWGVFTGDSLFVSSAGRPDLLGKDADKLASQLYDTLFGYFAKLADGVIIHPSHGHGSPCGADIGDRLESTIGYEKRFNPYYQKTEREEFIHHALSTAPPEPTYYKRMKRVNARGPEVLGHLPIIPALSADEFRKAVADKEGVLIDTRTMLAFGGGHIEGALNIGATPMLTIWAGWLLDPDEPILLVLEADTDVEKVAALFVRSGYTKFRGYLAGGMKSWDNHGFPLVSLQQMTVHEVQTCSDELQVLDVRAPAEWKAGHVPCAKHLFVPEIRDRAGELDKEQPTVTYCATGYRATIAASLLQEMGFRDVRTMPGSWTAWKAAGLPVSKDGDGK
ncbi:MAG: MBL fold metallo-hydrolase [Chthoniobacteraceae bacterium]